MLSWGNCAFGQICTFNEVRQWTTEHTFRHKRVWSSLKKLLNVGPISGADSSCIEAQNLLFDASFGEKTLHWVPRRVLDTHQTEDALQNIFDNRRWGTKSPDFTEGAAFDIAYCLFGLLDQRLNFCHFQLDFGFPLVQQLLLFDGLSFQIFHFHFLLVGEYGRYLVNKPWPITKPFLWISVIKALLEAFSENSRSAIKNLQFWSYNSRYDRNAGNGSLF